MGLVVINPGLYSTIQDEGRLGYREWGVPIGGAFDRGAAALANALVGNSTACAVLELTLAGGVYEAKAPLAIALAGALMVAAVLGGDGRRRPVVIPGSGSLGAGERLVLGGSAVGARTYLATRGGWRTTLVMGSRSRETRLRAGDLLPAEAGTIPTRHLAADLLKTANPIRIRIIDGPDASESIDPRAWDRLTFRVGPRSDRMGLRLEGEPLGIKALPERISAPVAPGAVQVAGGQLIILGVACGTMGGYPNVAHVISADLDRIGQARPGEVLAFERITLDEARKLDNAARVAHAELLGRVGMMANDPFGSEGAPGPESICVFGRGAIP